jgi:hypothetical protein
MAEQEDKSKPNEEATESTSQAEASSSKDESAGPSRTDNRLEDKAIGDMLSQLGLADVTQGPVCARDIFPFQKLTS